MCQHSTRTHFLYNLLDFQAFPMMLSRKRMKCNMCPIVLGCFKESWIAIEIGSRPFPNDELFHKKQLTQLATGVGLQRPMMSSIEIQWKIAPRLFVLRDYGRICDSQRSNKRFREAFQVICQLVRHYKAHFPNFLFATVDSHLPQTLPSSLVLLAGRSDL